MVEKGETMAQPPTLEQRNGMTVCLLASGSQGNCLYISNGQTRILVDAGLSGVEIERRMHSKGLCADRLSAIVVSHEHGDHIKGVGVLSRRFNLPVFATKKTWEAAAGHLGRIADRRTYACGASFRLGSIAVRPFSLSHDAADPAGFTFQCHRIKIGMATDLGVATAMVRQHLKESDLLVLEANHDVQMLETGPYPWPLKQRIRGRTGHLSNAASRCLLTDLLHDRLRFVVLAHLSETNNDPETAIRTIAPALNNSRACLSVARQERCSDLFELPSP
jgi:phosphoribosyl 1,2-cyclic phosphodiesterase